MRSSMTFEIKVPLRRYRSGEISVKPLRSVLPKVNKRKSLGLLLVNRLVVGSCRLAYMGLAASLCSVKQILI